MRFSCKTLILLCLLLPGCASYTRPTSYYLDCPPNRFKLGGYQPEVLQGSDRYARRQQALAHWIYYVIPRHHTQIRSYSVGHWLTWALFGNDDDGLFGEEESADYRPDEPISGWKATKWGARNPFHNLFFYVLGRAYAEPSQLGIISISSAGLKLFEYKKKGSVFAGSGGSGFFLGLHSGLPFISLRVNHFRQSNIYLGWRERGNLGFKAQLAKKIKPPMQANTLTDMESEGYARQEETP